MMEGKIFIRRIQKLREKLKEKNIEAAFVTKRENYIYLSGFTGTSAYLLITQDRSLLFTDFRYKLQAEKQAKDYEIIQYQGSLIHALHDMIKTLGLTCLGFEDTYMTYSNYVDYRDKLGIKNFTVLGTVIEDLRLLKDSSEIETIIKAVEIADRAFQHILGILKPGLTETEVAAELEYTMKKLGAKGASFDTIVASGIRSSMPHGVASGKKLESGDVITMDFGAIYQDYCSDMTRTVFLGQPKEELRKIYGTVLDSQMKALEGAKAGLTGKEIDAIARNIISRAGYGKNFGHGLGHGVGLEIHEEPRLSLTGDRVMQNSMVVTVEPGIYVEGMGGVRIEDMILIRDSTPVIMTKSIKKLIIL